MSELDTVQPQLPLPGVGPRLKSAREAQGLSRAELAGKTRIAERMIEAIEAGRFESLPSRAYAIGFSRSIARAVGQNEDEIVAEVRREMGMSSAVDARPMPSFEPGDPARVPGQGFAWLLGLVALAVIVAGGLFFWRTYTTPAMSLPPIEPTELASSPEVTGTAEASLAPILPDPLASATADPGVAAAPAVNRAPSARPSRAPARRPEPAPSSAPSSAAATAPAVTPAAQPVVATPAGN